ncbi:Clp protease N-terminal domain-containing protein [Hyphomicrobium sp. LHD-15]|uniref:toll/interleukin-1 receptor domain-containing protein n=1 Tax=Hyphomicrobium sp. LHD-15 TaxID=3072142 RepID=UPI0035BE7CAD
MPSFSKTLESTLHRSLEYANERNQEYATLEHLLLALIDDADAAKAMRACNGNLDALRIQTTNYLDQELGQHRTNTPTEAQPTTGFQRVIHRAVVQVQSSAKDMVTGLEVLIAIFSENESYAFHFLQEANLDRLDIARHSNPLRERAKDFPKSIQHHKTAKNSASQTKSVMTKKVFISYRREDSSGHTGRVHDRLEKEFGKELIFMDVDAIPLGVNFVKYISDEVGKSDVMLAIIGRDWLNACDENGRRRLDNPNDFVRIEISTALQRDIPVIPITVGGAPMPRVETLPEPLKELAFRNGLDIRHSSFHSDMDKLVKSLRRRLGRQS